MIYGYLRVSTDKQTLENQKFEINNFCENENIKIEKWVTETISGTKDFEKRKLGKLLKKLRKDDILICSEIYICYILYASCNLGLIREWCSFVNQSHIKCGFSSIGRDFQHIVIFSAYTAASYRVSPI